MDTEREEIEDEKIDLEKDVSIIQDDPFNEFGDNMHTFKWDGPEDSDEEIEEMVKMKTPFEIEQGIRFSKNGIV